MGHCLSSSHNFSYCKQMYCHLHCLKVKMTCFYQMLPRFAVYEVLGNFSHKVATGGQKSCEPIFRLTQSLHLLFCSSNHANNLLQLLTSVRVLQNLLPSRFFATRQTTKFLATVNSLQLFQSTKEQSTGNYQANCHYCAAD